MSSVVFILGAGASAQGGCPVMATFFSVAKRLHTHGRLSSVHDDYLRIERIRQDLERARHKIHFDTDNMEAVFSAIETGQFLGRLGNISDHDLEAARSSFIRLVLAVIEETQLYEVADLSKRRLSFRRKEKGMGALPDTGVCNISMNMSSAEQPIGPSGYDDLAHLAKFFTLEPTRVDSVSFITFNYDLGLDYALYSRDVRFSYAIHDNLPESCVPVCKLHGSLNWFMNGDELEIDSTIFEGIKNQSITKIDDPSKNPRKFRFMSSSHFARLKSLWAQPLPYIVPPATSKNYNTPVMGRMWKNAGDLISGADCVAIMGYSLPDSDQAVRQFLSLSLSAAKPDQQVWVFDQSSHTISRIGKIFTTSNRPQNKWYFGSSCTADSFATNFLNQYYNIDECI